MNAILISSNLVAESRIKTMEIYRDVEPPVIVATDLIARGMDIKNLDVVSNWFVIYFALFFRLSTTACQQTSALTFTGEFLFALFI